MVPVVHQRIVGCRGREVAATQIGGGWILLARAEVALAATEAVIKRLAPAAALVMDVPLVGAGAVAGQMVVGAGRAIQAGGASGLELVVVGSR